MFRIVSKQIRTVNKPLVQLNSFLSTTKEIKRVGVVGLGLMGHGIAQVTAQSGYEVVAIESSQDRLDAGMKRYLYFIYLYFILNIC